MLPQQQSIRNYDRANLPFHDLPSLHEPDAETISTVAQVAVGTDMVLVVNLEGHHTMRPVPVTLSNPEGKRAQPEYQVWVFDNDGNPLHCLMRADPQHARPTELLALCLPLAISQHPSHAALLRR